MYDEHTRELAATLNYNGLRIPQHSSRIFCTKFVPDDPKVFLTGAWDNTSKIYDTRVGKPVGQFLGPMVCGDSIDIMGDQVLIGSYRNADNLSIWSLSQRKKIFDIDFEMAGRRDQDSGYLFCAKFSKPDGRVIFAGGAGKREFKVFENGCNTTGTFKQQTHITDLNQPVLAADTAHNGEQVCFALADGKLYNCYYRIQGQEPKGAGNDEDANKRTKQILDTTTTNDEDGFD